MTADDVHRWKQPPPPRPRRRNVLIMRLYDAPIHRDPLAWWTLACAAISFVAILFPVEPRTSGLPPLLDALLAMVVLTILFAGVPSFLRLHIRRVVWKRRERRRSSIDPQAVITGDGPTSEATVRLPSVRPAQPTPRPDPRPMPRPGRAHPSLDPEPSGPPGRPDVPPPVRPPAPHEGRPPVESASGPATPADPGHRARAFPASRPAPTHESTIASSDILREARTLQYPIARAIRSLQSAPSALLQYQALIDAADALCMTVGVTGAAWLNATGADPDSLDEFVFAYSRGVTQGSWVTVARRAAKAAMTMADVPDGFTAFAQKPKKTWLARLDELTAERNEAAHGSRPRTEIQALERLGALLPALESALRGASYLAAVPWIYTTSSSYRARTAMFDVSAQRVMGDHPEFEPTRLTVRSPVENDRVHLAPEGREPIDLTPFVVVRNCEVCHSPELFYSDRRKENGDVVLKSAGQGHGLTDANLGEEFDSLAGSRRLP